ncbi:MAG: pilus assembly protein [Micromonosporaceae bacterium]|nr:pilus assembly protein [Micromonosporaceae bacterium]
MPAAVCLPDGRAGHLTSPAVPGPAPHQLRRAFRRSLRRRLAVRWRRVSVRRDAGAGTAELVVAMPLLLLIIMVVVQAGVWMHATHVAQAAASRAANVAAAYQSSADAGQRAGKDTLAALGHTILQNPQVTVTRTATEVRVEIIGTANAVVPGVHWSVKAVVVRPVEVFVPGGTP